MDWTDSALSRLEALWHEGVSTAEIGRRLGCSKNMVIGKAHRLDLPARPSPIKRNGHAAPRKPRPPRIKGPTLPPMTQPEPPAKPEPKPKPQFYVTCQWVETQRPLRFCDQPAIPDSPYCQMHHKLCYIPRRTAEMLE